MHHWRELWGRGRRDGHGVLQTKDDGESREGEREKKGRRGKTEGQTGIKWTKKVNNSRGDYMMARTEGKTERDVLRTSATASSTGWDCSPSLAVGDERAGAPRVASCLRLFAPSGSRFLSPGGNGSLWPSVAPCRPNNFNCQCAGCDAHKEMDSCAGILWQRRAGCGARLELPPLWGRRLRQGVSVLPLLWTLYGM